MWLRGTSTDLYFCDCLWDEIARSAACPRSLNVVLHLFVWCYRITWHSTSTNSLLNTSNITALRHQITVNGRHSKMFLREVWYSCIDVSENRPASIITTRKGHIRISLSVCPHIHPIYPSTQRQTTAITEVMKIQVNPSSWIQTDDQEDHKQIQNSWIP